MTEGSCTGGKGTTYSADVEFERGAEITFFFARASNADPNLFDIFFSTPLNEELKPTRFETLADNATNAAYYRYGAGEGTTPEMPATGAGGMAGGHLPIGGVAASVGPLAAAAYATRRRS